MLAVTASELQPRESSTPWRTATLLSTDAHPRFCTTTNLNSALRSQSPFTNCSVYKNSQQSPTPFLQAQTYYTSSGCGKLGFIFTSPVKRVVVFVLTLSLLLNYVES